MTKRFETVLAELGKRFDRIILDSPPLQPFTDAVVLSKRTDGVILVVRAGKTLRDELKRSARMIRDVGGTIFGVDRQRARPPRAATRTTTTATTATRRTARPASRRRSRRRKPGAAR